MNYLSMLKNITSIKNIRTSQLDKQENIDNELIILQNKCPHIVSEYLLFQRYLSRIQQKEMINSNIIDMASVINKHFDENNKIYDDFTKILNCENKCECLKDIICS
jgi:hypothetical protein